MDIGAWLRGLALERYEEAFRNNDIDAEILPELTADDLIAIGVVSVGHRRKLLAAIAALKSEVSGDGSGKSSPMPSSPAPRSQPEAQRRQLSVMFCDLVGSTALSARLDPEELREVVGAYHRTVAATVARLGGFVAKYMGDGVLVYFGYPQAQEDDAERAVMAGLDLVAAVGALNAIPGIELACRVGIATGLVVVGDLLGSGSAQEQTVVGETPNLAARLQSLAEPGTVLIDLRTCRLIGDLFEHCSLGAVDIKGFAGRQRVFQILGRGRVLSRFEALRSHATPLIGREEEIELLCRRWPQAKAGDGQVVLISGEAGIGKSRLTAALFEELASETHTRLRYFCSPHHTDSALHPVIAQLEHAAGFDQHEPPSAKLDKLDRVLSQVSTPAEDCSLIAELLSLHGTDRRHPVLDLTPQIRKERTLEALIWQLEALAHRQPVLMVFEDVHWIDPTSLELLDRMVEHARALPVLLLITFRPEFAAPWIGQPHVTVLMLRRLGARDSAALAGHVGRNHALAAELLDEIAAKTDGIPLFIEEMTKAVVESAGRDPATVPATLSASLMARLDRLGAAREVAQIAAVIGRQFAFALLKAVVPGGGDALETTLAQLVAAGIVFPVGRGLERGYSFKHALVRDAAYESLLLGRRRDWHERIARALEQHFPEIAANEPELLAYHFGAAGLTAPACDYRARAGERAMSRSAYKEAIAHFSAGLEAADAVPEPQDRRRRQLDFLLKLGAALTVTRGAQSVEVEEAYRRAAEIGEALGDATASYKAKWGLWLNANLARKTALARERARELVNLAHRSGDDDLLLEAYHCRWSTAFFRGDVKAALSDGRHGAELYDPARHRHLGFAFGGHDPGVCAHQVIAVTLRLSDDREGAAKSIARALGLAESLDHPSSLAHALTNIGLCHQIGGDREAVLPIARRLVELSDKYGLLPARAIGLLLSIWGNTTGPGVAEMARLIDDEIDKAVVVGTLPQYSLGLAGEVLLAAGRTADGLELLDRAIAAIEEPGVGFYLPEIYRLRGLCVLALDRGRKGEARKAFAAAHAIAERQGAVIFARRAKACLADL